MPLIDALKALASQLIVLHHLAVYGPLSDAFHQLAPDLGDWLFSDARLAVQVFLVVAGFLAARGLAPDGQPRFGNPLALIGRRYFRLAVPFVAAMAFAVACAAVARGWIQDDAIPERATLGQFIVHALLLHDLLDYDALSAGAWYVAIDLQLFALLAALLWIGRRFARGESFRPAPLLVIALGAASLFHFNRDSGWDAWGLYFFGSYALGAAAWWGSDPRRSVAWLGALWTVAIAALMVDFRARIALALTVALVLAVARRGGFLQRWPDWRLTAFLGRISYSVFLVHFPILLLVNGLFDRYTDGDPSQAVAGMLAAWGTSIAAGTLFHLHVESRSPEAWRRLAARLGGGLLRGFGFR